MLLRKFNHSPYFATSLSLLWFMRLILTGFRIGVIYNAAPGINRKEEVEQWAKEVYPDLWAELEKIGKRTTVEEIELFDIVRTVKS